MVALNCPFCGSPPRVLEGEKLVIWRVSCSNRTCGLAGAYMPVEEWNSRVGDNHKEAFRQFSESLAVLMRENELLMDRASHTEGVVSLVINLRSTNSRWFAGNIGAHQAAILNELMIVIDHCEERKNG